MNQLSWLLYWGNVSGNIGPLFGILSFVIILVSILVWILSIFVGEPYPNESELELRKSLKKYRVPLVVIGFVLAITAAFCPSSDTVYAIAASQVGESMLKTPTALKAEKAIDAWLDRQISPQPAK